MDLVGINFSYFAITFSINFIQKCAIILILAGTIFSENGVVH